MRQALRPTGRNGPAQLIAVEMYVGEGRQAVVCAPAQTLRISRKQQHGTGTMVVLEILAQEQQLLA